MTAAYQSVNAGYAFDRRYRYHATETRRSAKKRKQIRKYKRVRRKAVTVIAIELLTLVCIALAVLLTGGHSVASQGSVTTAGADAYITTSAHSPWNLVLVNKWNPIAKRPELELTQLSNGQRVDSRIYPDLQAMFDDARAQGVYPIVREGYRTYDEQKATYDAKVKAIQREGHLKKTAQQMAAQWVAIPGTSEHELGLAVDINADGQQSVNDEVYQWLAENAWKYGFILRYPVEKSEITGIDYEPWHYRYVGKEAAKTIYEEGLILEEYLKDSFVTHESDSSQRN
ncbi:MAG: M15 family metallopeptidase [Lachnospiraceae bacterium]|nr:M15 family metallopeptidase [Lachnospiraceae bacterium]